MYVEKTRTWNDNWNNVIRDVLFPDEKLKQQMMIPEGTSVVQFIDKYFINSAAADEIVTDEKVRIVYYDGKGRNLQRNVYMKYKEFDIYVREEFLYTATYDRLKSRFSLIAERIKYLLLRSNSVCHLGFTYEDEYELWTKTVGYRRDHLVFSYNTTE